MSNATNRESGLVFVGFFVGWILGVGGMALLLLDWTPYEAVGLSVAYMVLGFPIGYALGPFSHLRQGELDGCWDEVTLISGYVQSTASRSRRLGCSLLRCVFGFGLC